MDGQTFQRSILSPRILFTFCIAISFSALLLLPATLRAQAMGTATLENGTDAAIKPDGEIKPDLKTPEPKPQPPFEATPQTGKGPNAAIPAVLDLEPIEDVAPSAPPTDISPLKNVLGPADPASTKPAATMPQEKPAYESPLEKHTIRARTTDDSSTSDKTKTSSSPLPAGLGSAFQVATALTVVIGLIFIGKALAKKFVPGAKTSSGKGVIEILARYPLAKNQSIVLVRIGSQIIALNQGKEQSQSVLVISDPMEVAKLMGQIEGESPKSSTAGFTKLLANARMDLTDEANDPEQTPAMDSENLDEQLEEMAAAKRQLMELRHQVRSVRDRMST